MLTPIDENRTHIPLTPRAESLARLAELILEWEIPDEPALRDAKDAEKERSRQDEQSNSGADGALE